MVTRSRIHYRLFRLREKTNNECASSFGDPTAPDVDRDLTVTRIPNFQRTWQRILATPEAALIPDVTRQRIDQVVATLGPLQVAIDTSATGTIAIAQEIQQKELNLNRLSGAEVLAGMESLMDDMYAKQEENFGMHRPHVRATWDFYQTEGDHAERMMKMILAAVTPLIVPASEMQQGSQQ